MPSVGLARSVNRSAVLAALLSGRTLDRNQLIDAADLSRATVFRIVDDLRAEALIEETELERPVGRGRPPIGIRLVGSSRSVCGVDLGGTNCRFVIADLLGRTVSRAEFQTPAQLNGPELAEWITERVCELTQQDQGAGPLASVAIGLPGALSGDASRVVGSQNLPPIRGTTFIEAIHRHMGAPVTLENDSNLALLGEMRYGSLIGLDTVALLAIGTGLGSAAAIDGRILRAQAGRLGEFGSLNLPGSKTRIRDLVSGAGLVRYARESGLDISDARDVLGAPDQYSAIYGQITEAFIHLVAVVGLAYEPPVLLLTGGFALGLTDQLLRSVEASATEIIGAPISIQRASLGNYAGVFGALAAALDSAHTRMGVLAEHLPTIERDRCQVVQWFDQAPSDMSGRGQMGGEKGLAPNTRSRD